MKAIGAEKNEPPKTAERLADQAMAAPGQGPLAGSRSFGAVLEKLAPDHGDSDEAKQTKAQPARPRRDETRLDIGVLSGLITPHPQPVATPEGAAVTPLPPSVNPSAQKRCELAPAADGDSSDKHRPALPSWDSESAVASCSTACKSAETAGERGSRRTGQPQTPPQSVLPPQGSAHDMNEPSASAPPAGITSAQLVADMKFAQNWNEIAAGLPNLPADAATVTGSGPTSEVKPRPTRLPELQVSPVAAFINLPPPSAETQTKPAPAASPAAGPELLADGILREVHLCQQIKAESVSVMLQQEGDSGILLRITVCDGAVQVNARCRQDDFAALSVHWGQLQQSLAHQGIRLEPLTRSVDPGLASSFGGGRDAAYGDGRQRGQPFETDTETNPPPVGSSRATRFKGAKRRPVLNLSRLESWA
jgi:hypothetical protein